MGNYEVVISNKLKDKLIINQNYYHSKNADEYFAVFIKVLNNHVGILKENPSVTKSPISGPDVKAVNTNAKTIINIKT